MNSLVKKTNICRTCGRVSTPYRISLCARDMHPAASFEPVFVAGRCPCAARSCPAPVQWFQLPCMEVLADKPTFISNQAGQRVPLAYCSCNFAWSLLTTYAIRHTLYQRKGKRITGANRDRQPPRLCQRHCLQTVSPVSSLPLPIIATCAYLLRGLKWLPWVYLYQILNIHP
jgi:hypothetical protein